MIKSCKSILLKKFNKLGDIKYLLLIFFFLVIYFCPVFFFGKILFPDILLNYRPWSVNERTEPFIYSHLKSDLLDGYFADVNWVKERLKEGDIPLWNNIRDLGKPFIYFIVPNLLFLPHIIIWLFPTEIGFTLFTLLKVLFGGIGMFYWLNRMKISKSSSIIGSLAFMFSCFNIVWLFGSEVTINYMTPWLFLLIEKFYDKIVLKDIAFISLLIGGMILTGFIAGSGYVIYIASFYILLRLLYDFSKGLTKENLRIRLFSIFKSGILWLFCVILGAGLSALFLLPSLELISFINIDYRREVNSNTFLPMKSLLQILIPNYWGNPVYKNWVGVLNWNETSSFIGVIPISLILATPIISILKKNVKFTILSFLTVFCFLIIFGITPLLSIINKLPIFDSSSNTRLLGMFSFLGISVFSYTLDQALSKKFNKVIGFFLFCFMVILFILFTKNANYILETGLSSLNILDLLTVRFINIMLELGILAIFAISFILFIKRRIFRKELVIITMLLVFFDLCAFSFGHVPMVGKNYYYPETQSIKFLKNNLDINDRVLVFDGMFMISGAQNFYGLNSPITHNLHTVREKELIELFSKEAWMTDTAPGLKSEMTDFYSPIIDLYGIKYVVIAPNAYLDEYYEEQLVSDKVIGQIVKGKEFVQTIFIKETTINRMCFLAANYGEVKSGITTIKVKENNDGDVIEQFSWQNKDIIDNSYTCIHLDKDKYREGEYKIVFTAPDVEEGNGITLWGSLSDPYKGGELTSNASNVEVKDLAFRVFYEELDPKWRNVFYNSSEVSIYENMDYKDEAYWITSKNQPFIYDDFLKDLVNVSSHEVVYVEDFNLDSLNSAVVDTDSYVKVIDLESDYIKLELCSDHDGILNTREAYFPGWSYLIDKKPVDPVKVNYVFRGVPIEQGCHVVEQVYSPKSFKVGIIISLCSLIIILLLLFYSTKTNYKLSLFLRKNLFFKKK